MTNPLAKNRTLERRAWAAAVLIGACGCDGSDSAPKKPGELTRDEAEAIVAQQLAGFGKQQVPRADEDADRRLKFAVIGRWGLKDVPPTHNRMISETGSEEVKAPHPGPYLEFKDNATVRGTKTGVEQGSDGKRQIVLFDRDFDGTWDIRSGVLLITVKGSNHTSTQAEKLSVDGDTLTLRHTEDASAPPRVYTRTAGPPKQVVE